MTAKNGELIIHKNKKYFPHRAAGFGAWLSAVVFSLKILPRVACPDNFLCWGCYFCRYFVNLANENLHKKMHNKKILILLAVEEELGDENISAIAARHTLRLTGVGKLRAYESTLRALHEADYDVIINIGTCGSFSHPYATLLRPSVVAQGDIYLDSMFATKPLTLPTGDEGISIVSSDNFIGEDTPAAQREKIAKFDCMDMESYAVLRAIRLHASLEGKPAPEVYMLKMVSDGADATIGDWSERIEGLRPLLREELEKLLNVLEDEN